MCSLSRFVTVLALLLAVAPAVAQEPVAQGKPDTKLDAKTFDLPPSAYDTGKFSYAPPKVESGGFNPGRVDLGSSVLQLDTKRQEPSTRVGIETIDPKLLGGISKDNSSALPHYFGMTLSKPLN
jgi:hypothetical protein